MTKKQTRLSAKTLGRLWMPATEAAAAINAAEAGNGRKEDFSAVIRRMAVGR